MNSSLKQTKRYLVADCELDEKKQGAKFALPDPTINSILFIAELM